MGSTAYDYAYSMHFFVCLGVSLSSASGLNLLKPGGRKRKSVSPIGSPPSVSGSTSSHDSGPPHTSRSNPITPKSGCHDFQS